MSEITGNAEFNNSTNNGIITGEVVFTGDAVNNGTVDGNAAFYDNCVNNGEITQEAAFLGEAQNNGDIGATMNAPQIIAHPQSIKKLIGTGAAEFEISADGALMGCGWTAPTCGVFLNGGYAQYRIISIDDPGYPKTCDVVCKIQNPVGEVNSNLAVCIFGLLPTVNLNSPGNVIVNEYQNVTLRFTGTSNDDKVYAQLVSGANNDENIAEPVEIIPVNHSFNFASTDFVVATNIQLIHNNKQVRLKIFDSFGYALSEQFLLVVNDIYFHPQIIQHPQSVEAVAGQTITFTIQTNPLTPVSEYLWGTATMGSIGFIPEEYNPVGINTDTLTITLPNDLPLGPLTVNAMDLVLFSCQIKGPDSPGDGTGAQYFLNSNAAGVTIVAPPEE